MALKILLAEDEEALSRVYKASLEHQGYEVDQAFNGQEAVDLAAQNAYQVMIMDIMMPKLDGYQTCALIKHNREFKNTPVIMLSSKDGLFDRAKGRVVGAAHYLTKPFTSEDLLESLAIAQRAIAATSNA